MVCFYRCIFVERKKKINIFLHTLCQKNPPIRCYAQHIFHVCISGVNSITLIFVRINMLWKAKQQVNALRKMKHLTEWYVIHYTNNWITYQNYIKKEKNAKNKHFPLFILCLFQDSFFVLFVYLFFYVFLTCIYLQFLVNFVPCFLLYIFLTFILLKKNSRKLCACVKIALSQFILCRISKFANIFLISLIRFD